MCQKQSTTIVLFMNILKRCFINFPPGSSTQGKYTTDYGSQIRWWKDLDATYNEVDPKKLVEIHQDKANSFLQIFPQMTIRFQRTFHRQLTASCGGFRRRLTDACRRSFRWSTTTGQFNRRVVGTMSSPQKVSSPKNPSYRRRSQEFGFPHLQSLCEDWNQLHGWQSPTNNDMWMTWNLVMQIQISIMNFTNC